MTQESVISAGDGNNCDPATFEMTRLALFNQGKDTARLSHDLNNRLFAVSGRVELLRDALNLGDEAKVKRLLENIFAELSQLGEKVHELNEVAHRYDLLAGIDSGR
ncbi:MAG TPA: hypothetical protein PKH07_12925 [bacterium]|nr:hypothetical protein [bacterium]